MKHLKISAKHRNRTGTTKCGQMRREGLIPAVIYGPSGVETIKLDTSEFRRVMREAAGMAALIDILIDNGQQRLAMVKEVKRHSYKDYIEHVDFHEVSADKPMHAVLPVHVHGEAEGVKAGGIIDVVMHSLNIQCLPKDLPQSVELDVTALNIGDAIHVKELPKLEGVTFDAEESAVVVGCVAPKVVAEPEPEAETSEAEGEVKEGDEAKEAESKESEEPAKE